MLTPDPFPLHPEPGSESARFRTVHLCLELSRTDPAPGVDLARVRPHVRVTTPDEDRAELAFGPGRIELRLVLEFEQKMQRAGEPQLLHQAAVNGSFHALRASRMAAAAVGPVQRPESLAGRALLSQQLTP